MVDARFPSRWLLDRRFTGLSDRAFRTFTNALALSNEQGSDGLLRRDELRFLVPSGEVDDATVRELVAAGLWAADRERIQVVDWAESQSTASEVAAYRAKARERQARARAARKSPKSEPVTGDKLRDVTRDVGKAKAKGLGTERPADSEQGSVVRWPTAAIPSGEIGRAAGS